MVFCCLLQKHSWQWCSQIYNLIFRKGDINNNDSDDFEQDLIKKEDKDNIDKQACGALVETTTHLGEGFVDETFYPNVDVFNAEELARNLTTIKKEVDLVNGEARWHGKGGQSFQEMMTGDEIITKQT